MDPMVGAAAVAGGSEFLSSLAARIFGSGDRKRMRRFAEYLRKQTGKPVFGPGEIEQLMLRIDRAGAPERQRTFEHIARRTGVESPAAYGEWMRATEPERLRKRAEIPLMAKKWGMERDVTYNQLAARLYGSLA